MASLLWLGLANRQAGAADAPADNNAPLRYEEPKALTASIYLPGDARNKPLFRFKRQATRSGSTLNVLREFAYPDGTPASRETVTYTGNDLAAFGLEDLQTGAHGRAQIRRDGSDPTKGTILFEYSPDPNAHDRSKTKREPLGKDVLVADMVAPFITSHWDALLRGTKVKCRYIVVPRAETVGFTFVRDSDSRRQGTPVVIIRMEPTSPIISALVDPLFFTVEQAEPHRVLEYSGRTTPKIKVGGKWKDLEAVTVFDWRPARGESGTAAVPTHGTSLTR